MKNVAFLEYCFMFDPQTTFSNVYDFETKLAAFFKSEGYEAQPMETVRGQMGRGVFFITKANKDMLDKAGENDNQPVKKI